MTITDFYTLALANGGLRLFLVGKEHLFKNRNAAWIACNFDITIKDAKRLVKKADELRKREPIVHTPAVFVNTVDNYYEMLAHNRVNAKCGGENYNPYFSSNSGFYYTLSLSHREQFDELVRISGSNAPIVIDVLYKKLSITGAASVYGISVEAARSIVNSSVSKLTKFIPTFDLHTRRVIFPDELRDIAITNDFVFDTDAVFDFLQTNKDIRAYAKEQFKSVEEFKKDVERTCTSLYTFMRCNNYVLVTNTGTSNLSSYTRKGEPFVSKWVKLNSNDIIF